MTSEDGSSIEGVNLAGVREYLAGTPIVFAILFGSYARGTASESSDVDIAIKLPEEMNDHERFDTRNRIDAELQEYADEFVDVSDVDSLPNPVAYAALREGIVLVGGERVVETYREQVGREYEKKAHERERERRDFIDRLARGDT